MELWTGLNRRLARLSKRSRIQVCILSKRVLSERVLEQVVDQLVGQVVSELVHGILRALHVIRCYLLCMGLCCKSEEHSLNDSAHFL